MTGTKYPYKYPSGKGSSHQYVVGCGPVPELEAMKTLTVARNMSEYFWMVEHWGKESDTFSWENVRVLQTGDMISLLNWRHFTKLNSHNVAAPISHNKHEVTGYIEYRYVMFLVLPNFGGPLDGGHKIN